MEVWQWVVTCAGGIVAVAGAVSAVKNFFRPLLDLKKEVEQLKTQTETCKVRFENLSRHQGEAREANQAVYKALNSIMNHMIDGNGIESLKSARDDLSRFIIEH